MVSSSLFKVFGMTRPGIEPRSPGPLANTLTAGPMSRSHTPIYIIIIMSLCEHESSWPSLTTRLYRPLLPGGLPGYILYQRRAVICRFLQVVLPLLVHVKGSTELCYLWVRPYFSNSVPHVWFIEKAQFSWWVLGGRIAAVLRVVASRTCSIHLAVF